MKSASPETNIAPLLCEIQNGEAMAICAQSPMWDIFCKNKKETKLYCNDRWWWAEALPLPSGIVFMTHGLLSSHDDDDDEIRILAICRDDSGKQNCWRMCCLSENNLPMLVHSGNVKEHLAMWQTLLHAFPAFFRELVPTPTEEQQCEFDSMLCKRQEFLNLQIENTNEHGFVVKDLESVCKLDSVDIVILQEKQDALWSGMPAPLLEDAIQKRYRNFEKEPVALRAGMTFSGDRTADILFSFSKDDDPWQVVSKGLVSWFDVFMEGGGALEHFLLGYDNPGYKAIPSISFEKVEELHQASCRISAGSAAEPVTAVPPATAAD